MTFGVLLSCAFECEVTVGRFDDALGATVPFAGRQDATAYGSEVTRHGLEYELMRRADNGLWRDVRGRTPVEVTRARWQ